MKVILHGSTGRMGQMMASLMQKFPEEFEICAFVSPEETENGNHYTELTHFTGKADMVIDFSHHSATESLMSYCVSRGLPVIVATTGQTPQENESILNASKSIPIFQSGNMSVGIALLAMLAQKTAKMFPTADIEIVEAHHNQKLDVPSGTAKLLFNRIREVRPNAESVVGRHENGKRAQNEIGIHSLRMGGEVGTHEILFACGSETITLKHEAENRALFADGALAAARFLINRGAGLYDMRDLIQE